MDTKKKIYLASSWFTEDTRNILSALEEALTLKDDVSLYSPRRDGIVLPPNQHHDTALRESIFQENIKNIDSSDIVVANIYSGDSYNDPGTIYEIGYAMAHGIPVIGFTVSGDVNIHNRFKGILDGFDCICTNLKDLVLAIDEITESSPEVPKNKVLFIGSGEEESDKTLVSYIMDSGANIRWINHLHKELYTRIEEIFEGVEYMIAVIDDRKTVPSWFIGQAAARGIPIVTYSNHNYGINVMLLCSVLTHIRGTEELQSFLHQVNKGGILSIPKFDISQMESM